jgi:succinyl-CoA synthetase alpha subunit
MSILINKDTKVITQGITGKTGQFHTRMCRTTPTARTASSPASTRRRPARTSRASRSTPASRTPSAETGATVSVIYVPPAGAAAAIWEAVEADLDLAICITEGIPGARHAEVRNKMKAKEAAGGKKTLLLGPNCPGLITPDEIKIGIMPGPHPPQGPHRRGQSRSGTLTYEAVAQLTEIGLGQSSAVGIGGDPINGLKHIDVMRMFNDDPDTDAVIMIGEIGGPDEAEAARWCKANMKKPIVGFIAGVTAPAGKRMGHAGALISGGADTADAKLAIMEECGFKVTRNPSEMGPAAQSVFLVMELLPGSDLSRYARPDRLLPEAAVLEIAEQLALALAHAHRHGVAHRDVKPANVIYDPATRRAVLTDFGLARAPDAQSTRSGVMLGSPAYMAPELLAGARADGRSDMYALGVLVFELLTGRPPFAEPGLGALLQAVATRPPPPLAGLRPSLTEPAALDELLAPDLAVLADGMGGYNAGEWPAAWPPAFIRDELGRWLAEVGDGHRPRSATRDGHLRRQRQPRHLQCGQGQPAVRRHGHHLVVAVFRDPPAAWATSATRAPTAARRAHLMQLTRDHSLLQEQIDAGLITPEQASFSANKNLVTRAVGVEDTVLLEPTSTRCIRAICT